MSDSPTLTIDEQSPERIVLEGDWTLPRINELQALFRRLPDRGRSLDASGVEQLDSAGALMLARLARRLGVDADAVTLREEHRALVSAIDSVETGDEPDVAAEGWPRQLLAHIGEAVVGLGSQSRQLLGFLGLTLASLFAVVRHPRRLRITSTVFHMEKAGLDAVPLILLLNFLVGAVIAFLGATVLREFGAEFFVVELVGFAFMREFGVLLTAILLAGRTASAFTAQIGAMKAREEIDAIRVLGLDPVELLVIPRLLALLIMLPLLAFLAVVAGLAGGMLVGLLSLDISPEMFLARLDETIQLRHYLVGLSKAPVFALVIAVVGCMEGFKVGGTAQSVGERTTSSVVQSISLVIILDAIFAIFFMEMGW